MSSGVAGQFATPEQQADAARLGLWVFVATEVMLFAAPLLGYVYGRMHFPDAFAAASRQTQLTIGTVNTAVLLTSSVTMALAVAARRDRPRLAGWLLMVTASLGVVFLALKGVEYRNEWQAHRVPGVDFRFTQAPAGPAELFYCLYFVMTGVHALHLTVGVVIAAGLGLLLSRRHDAVATENRVETTGLYWHFVDVVWIFLYPILYLVGRAT